VKIKKIAEGAYFVPSYYIPVIESRVPGIINQTVISTKTEQPEDDLSNEEDNDAGVRSVDSN